MTGHGVFQKASLQTPLALLGCWAGILSAWRPECQAAGGGSSGILLE